MWYEELYEGYYEENSVMDYAEYLEREEFYNEWDSRGPDGFYDYGQSSWFESGD